MITIIISLLLGIFFSLVGFKIYKPKLNPNTDTKKWEANLKFFQLAGIALILWALIQLLVF